MRIIALIMCLCNCMSPEYGHGPDCQLRAGFKTRKKKADLGRHNYRKEVLKYLER